MLIVRTSDGFLNLNLFICVTFHSCTWCCSVGAVSKEMLDRMLYGYKVGRIFSVRNQQCQLSLLKVAEEHLFFWQTWWVPASATFLQHSASNLEGKNSLVSDPALGRREYIQTKKHMLLSVACSLWPFIVPTKLYLVWILCWWGIKEITSHVVVRPARIGN